MAPRLHPAGQVTEARFLGAVDNPNYPPYTVSGYYDHDHLDHMAQLVSFWSPRSTGSYFIFNPIDPELMSLAANRVIKKAKRTTEDKHVLRLRNRPGITSRSHQDSGIAR